MGEGEGGRWGREVLVGFEFCDLFLAGSVPSPPFLSSPFFSLLPSPSFPLFHISSGTSTNKSIS